MSFIESFSKSSSVSKKQWKRKTGVKHTEFTATSSEPWMRALGGQHHCTLWRSFRNVNGGRTVLEKLGQTLHVTLFGERLYLWSKTDDYRDRSNLDEILKTYIHVKNQIILWREGQCLTISRTWVSGGLTMNVEYWPSFSFNKNR